MYDSHNSLEELRFDVEGQANGLLPRLLGFLFPRVLVSPAKLCLCSANSIIDPSPFIIRSCRGIVSNGHHITKSHCSVNLLLSATMVALPNCRNVRRCKHFATSVRATLCASCFKEKAARSGTLSRGNVHPKINEGNKGNLSPTINIGNRGNTKTHDSSIKEKAGARSGMKRSSKIALVVKKEWLDKILSGEKDWEIRSTNTSIRGWIHFAQSGAGSKLQGRAQLVDSFELTKTEFIRQKLHHCVPRSSQVPYTRMYAWVLRHAERFPDLFEFERAPGAVVWVGVS